jgi:hypothetical protein
MKLINKTKKEEKRTKKKKNGKQIGANLSPGSNAGRRWWRRRRRRNRSEEKRKTLEMEERGFGSNRNKVNFEFETEIRCEI